MLANLKALTRSASIELSLGTVDGKAVTKTVTLSRLTSVVTADVLNTVITALGNCLEYPITTIKIRDTSLLEAN